jgi:hypothetical protein
MRGLAEFVMTGRKQAIMAVLLLGLIPLVNLLNPVVVGLVMLRKGVSEASIILAWAILPVGGWAIAGDIVPLIMLIGISGLSLLLRKSSRGNSHCSPPSRSESPSRFTCGYDRRCWI